MHNTDYSVRKEKLRRADARRRYLEARAFQLQTYFDAQPEKVAIFQQTYFDAHPEKVAIFGDKNLTANQTPWVRSEDRAQGSVIM